MPDYGFYSDNPPMTCKPLVIPVFIPHEGCSHRCVFCDQSVITGLKEKLPSERTLKEYISRYLSYKTHKRYPVQISFYGGTFLGLDNDVIKELLKIATEFVCEGEVNGIRFSTRPDTVTDEKLDLISSFPVTTVELGVQSMDREVLTLSGRGHGPEHTEKASRLLSERGYETGFQIMVGLPGDDMNKSMKTVESLYRLNPSFMRIYPTLVLKGSALERLYEKKIYAPLSLDTAVSYVKQLYLYLKCKGVPVIRMGLQSSEELDQGSSVVAGPYHPSFGHLVYSEIFLEMAVLALKKEIGIFDKKKAEICVHSKSISKIRGLKNNNIDVLKKMFDLDEINVTADDRIDLESLKMYGNKVEIKDLYREEWK